MAADLRYSRTEKNIRAAFLELLKTKKYEKIRVADIIERAEVSRNAFYLHYYNKDVLLESILDSYVQKFSDGQDNVLRTSKKRDLNAARACVEAIISPFYEDVEMTRLLFSIQNGEIATNYLATKLRDYFYSRAYNDHMSNKEKQDTYLYCGYRAFGVIGSLRYNFQDGQVFDLESLVDLLQRINTGDALVTISPFRE